MEKFNSTLRDFLNVIKQNYSEQTSQIDNYYIFNEENNEKYILEFWNNCKDKGTYISSKNEIIFSKHTIILKNIDFNKIWNDENLEDAQRDNIWKYIHTLWLFAYEHINEKDVKSVLKTLKKMGMNNQDLDEESQTLLNIIDSLTHKYDKKVDASGNEIPDEDETATEDDGAGMFNIPDLLNGTIGDLAKEIAEEIDPSELDFSNINKAELMQNIMSGNFDEENDKSGVSKLVKKITTKVKDKIESGAIDQEKLKEEAMNIMKKFGGKGGKGGSKMANVFKDIIKTQMPNMSAEEKEMVDQASKILEFGNKANMKPQQMQNRLQLRSTKERLLKKLEEKKKAKEAAETTQQTTQPVKNNNSNNNNTKQITKSKPKK